MKEERGFFNSKSPDGGCILSLIVLAFVLYTLSHLDQLMLAMDKHFGSVSDW